MIRTLARSGPVLVSHPHLLVLASSFGNKDQAITELLKITRFEAKLDDGLGDFSSRDKISSDSCLLLEIKQLLEGRLEVPTGSRSEILRDLFLNILGEI